jgi:hypothetical protein
MTDKEFTVFQKLIDEKLIGLHKEIISGNTLILEKIDGLNNTVLKQNSRIGKLEDYKEYTQGVIDKRIVECPHIPRFEECEVEIKNTKESFDDAIKKIEKSLEDVLFFVRHPKLFIGLLVTLVILTLASIIENNPFEVFTKDNNANQTEQTK